MEIKEGDLAEQLLSMLTDAERTLLRKKASDFYFEAGDFSKAAFCSFLAGDKFSLKKILFAAYKKCIAEGKFEELREWLQEIEKDKRLVDNKLIAVKGILLASTGHFSEALNHLDKGILEVGSHDKEFGAELKIYKARVLRHTISFEASIQMLNELLLDNGGYPSEAIYFASIEQLHNLCWTSNIQEAYRLADTMAAAFEKEGNHQLKTGIERYLCAIHFFAGRMKDAVRSYEKAGLLTEGEEKLLFSRNIGIYAARAYQMTGDEAKALSIISTELEKLRSAGRLEELWAGYLLASEIYESAASKKAPADRTDLEEESEKYLTLAENESRLYSKTDLKVQWTQWHILARRLRHLSGRQDDTVLELFSCLDNANGYAKTMILNALAGYFHRQSDFTNAILFARQCIKAGETNELMLYPALSYGLLAKSLSAMGERERALHAVRRYLELCSENHIYEPFFIKEEAFPLFDLAYDSGEADCTPRPLADIAGYQPKKAFITTFGGFCVYQDKERLKPLKMRTKKERELLAFILDAGEKGVTKDQIIKSLFKGSKSEDIKKLIGVNLAHIKRDLAVLGIGNAILNQDKHYRVNKHEISADIDLFTDVTEKFQAAGSAEAAREMLLVYKGDYLKGIESDWVKDQRIKYRNIYGTLLEKSSG